ncbi:MAG: type II secretion system F family protein [Acidimicrobiales bacterium]
MSIVIAICAALVGLLLVAATGAATGRITVPPKGTHKKIDIQPKKLPWAILIGIVFLLWTHLVLAAVVAAGLPYLLPALRLKNPQAAMMARLEGLVSWSEALRDQVRSTGIEEALRRASTPPPPALERELSNLVANLDPRVALSTGDALRRFADDMADPACDTIIAPLIMSVEQQAKGVADLLGALTAAGRNELAMRGSIEAKRAPAYLNVRMVIYFSLGFFGFLMVIAKGYMLPFTTASGEVVMGVAFAFYGVGLVLMLKLIRQVPEPRLLGSRKGTR